MQVTERVTDEMVELACKAITDRRGFVWPDEFSDDEQQTGRENMRAALTAALSDQERAVEVEALQWQALDNGTAWSNTTMVGLRYHATPEGWMHRNGNLNPAAGLEAAKAAAQSDYEQRIRSALVDVPVEPAAWRSDTGAYFHGAKRPYVGPSISLEPLYTSPLSHRGEDSAEVERAIVEELQKARSDYMINDFTIAKRILAALAATRSGSASSASGGHHGD